MDKEEYRQLYNESLLLRKKADLVRKTNPVKASRLDEEARKIEDQLDKA